MVNTTPLITLVISVLGTCMNFELKCPDSSQRIARAHIICNGTSTSKYYCLFDENRRRFVEQCKEEPDHVRPGEKYVITGRRRNVECSSEKLQPYLFWSNVSSDCVFVKSKCNEPGQVVYNNGTTKRDRACRCDYTKGFKFITMPKDPCYCIPSKEDCSCYHTACAGNAKLTPDFECVTRDQDTFYSYCPPILHNRMKTNHSTKKQIFKERKSELEDRIYIKYGSIIIFCLIVCAGLILIFHKLLICNGHSPLPDDILKEQIETKFQNAVNVITETVHKNLEKKDEDSNIRIQELMKNQEVRNRIDMMRMAVLSKCRANSLFVMTKGFNEIMRTLREKHYVLIKGNPGDGKTELAYFAMKDLIEKQKKKPLQLKEYLDWDKFVTPDKNFSIFIDNLFGEFTVSNNDVMNWRTILSMIPHTVSNEQHSNYVIICIRSDIFLQCEDTFSTEFLKSALVDISYGKDFHLTKEEMKEIFHKFVPEDNNIVFEGKMSKMLKNVQKLGFPQCCRFFKDNMDSMKDNKSIVKYFTNPLSFLKKQIKDRFRSRGMSMAVLVCVLLYGGKVKKSILCDRKENRDLKEKAMEMCSVIVDITLFEESIQCEEAVLIEHDVYDDTIKFAHSSIQSAVFVVVGEHNPHDLIQNCHYTLLSLITTSESFVKGVVSLKIPDSCFAILWQRIRELLCSSSPCSSKVLKIVSELFVWNDKTFLISCPLDFENVFVEAIDDHDCSLFSYFSAIGCMVWVKRLCSKITDRRQLTLALEVACGANQLNTVRFLLSNKVQPNIECCFSAVRSGNVEILKALAEAKVDFTVKCHTHALWVIRPYVTNVLDEATLLNQCHLIEHLLALCPELIHAQASDNSTLIHWLARSGRVDLLEKYLATDSFSEYDKSINNSTILHFACQNKQIDTVRYIVETYPNLLLSEHFCCTEGTILHIVAQSGSVELFKYVHQQIIARSEKENLTSITLDNGCYVDEPDSKTVKLNKLLHVRDKRGRLLLIGVACLGSIELFKYVAKQIDELVDEREIQTIMQALEKINEYLDKEEMISFIKETYGSNDYVGCFIDRSKRLLPHEYSPPDLENNLCVLYCKEQGYMFSGTEAGRQCFCGNDPFQYGFGDNCNHKCIGDPEQICGGNYQLSVYGTGYLPLKEGQTKYKLVSNSTILTAPAYQVLKSRTEIQCALYCKIYDDCKVFVVSTETGECRLYNSYIVMCEGVIDVKGFQVYMMK